MAVNTKAEGIDTGLVRQLADILTETNLTEIEVERGDLKIRVARGGTSMTPVSVATPIAYAPDPGAPVRGDLPVRAAPEAAAIEAAPKGDVVKSPMVGTVYLQAGPDADVFIKVGDKVSQGQTLLIIEAMKTMNPIAAPKTGVVRQIMVDNEQPVEFGAPLVILE